MSLLAELIAYVFLSALLTTGCARETSNYENRPSTNARLATGTRGGLDANAQFPYTYNISIILLFPFRPVGYSPFTATGVPYNSRYVKITSIAGSGDPYSTQDPASGKWKLTASAIPAITLNECKSGSTAREYAQITLGGTYMLGNASYPITGYLSELDVWYSTNSSSCPTFGEMPNSITVYFDCVETDNRSKYTCTKKSITKTWN